MRYRRPSLFVSGFSLLELLVVIAIMAIMAVLSSYAMRGVMAASQLTSATDSIVGTLTYARQAATTMSHDVEVRLLTLPGVTGAGASEIRALQLIEVTDAGKKQLGRTRFLPTGVMINSTPTLSTLARLPVENPGSGDPSLPEKGLAYTYRKFSFRPDGSTTLPLLIQNPPPDQFFLSVHQETPGMSTSTLPPNFATIQIEPLTGAVTAYRP